MSKASASKSLWGVLRLSDDATNLKASARAEGGCEKDHSYKPLPTRFQRSGFNYRQIAREGDTAIYEQSWGGCADPSVCYEVVCIRRREGFKIKGRSVPPSEVYPKAEAWGVDGWTVQDKETAFRKLREIISQKAGSRPC